MDWQKFEKMGDISVSAEVTIAPDELECLRDNLLSDDCDLYFDAGSTKIPAARISMHPECPTREIFMQCLDQIVRRTVDIDRVCERLEKLKNRYSKEYKEAISNDDDYVVGRAYGRMDAIIKIIDEFFGGE